MNLRRFEVLLKFTQEQRKGVFLLFIIIAVLQAVYFLVDFDISEKIVPEEKQWMNLQSEIDSLKFLKSGEKRKVYAFNPNFITDYKAYKLGMSVQEIDRLLAFRKENKYVNSAKEFQEVTKISDSLLRVISPLFKFPEWVTNKSSHKIKRNEFFKEPVYEKEEIIVQDMNSATQEDLVKIYGIGEALSIRILKQREVLGGFVSMEQMNEVWGLSPEVVKELTAHFKVAIPPSLKKIAINEASLKELAKFPYFRYALAKEIVTYRSMNGNINNIEDLSKIKGFPIEKAKIISLYLEF
ncbi:ComEA family DNA-binding protein [Flavobacterium lipolyticum]|uniref:Helix-hairpin-helix domain-containing protein n=1 Tax=Flavobacterium lipolyticum TaxID=2893754 RepID=A0ABS8M1U5_9FLAO|nr:helix-hairpin-helix domain-containing protein [Flavobacterium sp. F-126]MCC9018809.1 helix-hairpin-helix domain-containing protein [Flavobacterium sp. F-126]